VDDDFRTDAAPSTRWFDVGVSSERDPYRAGAAAASRALTGRDPRLLVVFCSIRLDPHAVLAGIKEVASGIPLIGCSSGAEIGVEGAGMGLVAVAAFGGSGFTVRTSAATGTRTAPREGGIEVARSAFAGMAGPHQLMLLLTDGLVEHQDDIIDGVYEMLGAGVVLAGGAAGKIRPGRHVKYKPATPLANLHLSVLDLFDVKGVDQMGDSTGRREQLTDLT